MWLEQLHLLHIIDTSAFAMGIYMRQHSNNELDSSSILCALSMQALKNGHTCLDCTNLTLQFPALSQLPELINIIETDSILEHPFIGHNHLHENTLFTVCFPFIFTNKFFDLETKLIHHLASRINPKESLVNSSNASRLADLCSIKPLTILSGGPGTGKTTVFAQALPHWIERFQQEQNKTPRIILCAPTGKAAARMTESWLTQRKKFESECTTSLATTALPEQAITIHRLLGIQPLTRVARFNKNNLLAVDLLVIDEASMIDLPLFEKILDACPRYTHVLLIGDQQQLPAIEAGNILGSLCDTHSNLWFFKQLNSAHLHLSHNFRQQDNHGLSNLARDCLNVNTDTLLEKLNTNNYANVSLLHNNTENIVSLIKHASDMYKEITNQNNVEQVLLKLRSFIILTAVREGQSGCVYINQEISRHLNPNFSMYFHGQILLITENANHLNLANGDVVIVWQEAQSLKAYFYFNNTTHFISIDQLPKHEPAYALTVHKSQGSEYDEVNIILPPYECAVLNTALFYTAITRAKTQLQIVATQEALISCFASPSLRVNGLRLLAEQLVQNEIQ